MYDCDDTVKHNHCKLQGFYPLARCLLNSLNSVVYLTVKEATNVLTAECNKVFKHEVWCVPLHSELLHSGGGEGVSLLLTQIVAQCTNRYP